MAAGPPSAITSVGIVGSGRVGSGIAGLCLANGLEVRLFDPDSDAAGRDAAPAGSQVVGELAEVAAGADLVVVAVPGDLPGLLGLFRVLDEAAAADTVLATAASLDPVSACAAATRRPERVIGLHVVDPDAAATLVEIALAPRTSERTVERATAFARSLGATPLHCTDAPGFVVDRVGRPFLVEAIRLVESGQASVAAVDAAVEAAGYPLGPFRLLERIGPEVELVTEEALAEAFGGATRFGPPDLLRRLVDGRSAQVRGGHRTPGDHLAAEAIVERLELAVISEAYRAVEEGVALPQDVDTAMRLGAGHPRGPFERVAELGLRRVVQRLHALDRDLRATSGDQYEVARLLWQMATA
jgi:3-hydroxybutyryl-CoA dehydrogenase